MTPFRRFAMPKESTMKARPKSFHLSPKVHEYLLSHGSRPDEIGQGLIDATTALGGISMMQIAPEQGALMTLITRLMGVRRAIEVGTFTGYSALCVARGLPEDGELICCDVSVEWPAIGQPFWERAQVADRIDLRIGPAIETLRSLTGADEGSFDLAFIDADKPSYRDYCEELLRLVRRGGLILVDNVLWNGAVVEKRNQESNTVAIRAFNDWIAADDRVESVMLPISDGLTFIRVR
jgi:caffeoyl-CoA O-methyltransferase